MCICVYKFSFPSAQYFSRSTAIPLGYAFGFIIGGKWIDANVFGAHWSWRVLFMSQSVLMLPLIALSLIITGPASLKALAAQIERMREAEKRLADGSVNGGGLDSSSALSSSSALVGSTSSIHVVPHSSSPALSGISIPYGGTLAKGSGAAAGKGGTYGTVGTVATTTNNGGAASPDTLRGERDSLGSSYRSSIDGNDACYDINRCAQIGLDFVHTLLSNFRLIFLAIDCVNYTSPVSCIASACISIPL